MQVWTSKPLKFAAAAHVGVSRVDLEFEGVEHDQGSFAGLIYLNNPDATADTGRDKNANFACGFSVFAHRECWGEDGHCDPVRHAVNAFDRRPESDLAPFNVTIDITDAIHELKIKDRVSVTVVASGADTKASADVLRFERLTLVVYE